MFNLKSEDGSNSNRKLENNDLGIYFCLDIFLLDIYYVQYSVVDDDVAVEAG